jgi:hypothetical protein
MRSCVKRYVNADHSAHIDAVVAAAAGVMRCDSPERVPKQ